MKKYTALQTMAFKGGLADIIKGKTYQGDKDQEYFINEFNETIYLSKEDFGTYFKVFERGSHRKATQKYFKNNVKVIYLRLFPSDQDIIEFLDNLKEPTRTNVGRTGASEYIRKLIREDMQKQKGK